MSDGPTAIARDVSTGADYEMVSRLAGMSESGHPIWQLYLRHATKPVVIDLTDISITVSEIKPGHSVRVHEMQDGDGFVRLRPLPRELVDEEDR